MHCPWPNAFSVSMWPFLKLFLVMSMPFVESSAVKIESQRTENFDWRSLVIDARKRCWKYCESNHFFSWRFFPMAINRSSGEERFEQRERFTFSLCLDDREGWFFWLELDSSARDCSSGRVVLPFLPRSSWSMCSTKLIPTLTSSSYGHSFHGIVSSLLFFYTSSTRWITCSFV